MIKNIQKLHDSYKSPEARKTVDYMFDIADKSLTLEYLESVIKNIADDSEYLWNKVHNNI